jgi:YHS domain-containing protein
MIHLVMEFLPMSHVARRLAAWICLLVIVFAVRTTRGADNADGPKPDALAKDKQALAGFQAYVGEWKGVGQLRRGSSQGSWIEEAQWAWHFADQLAELTAALANGRFYSKLQLQAGDKPGQFRLIGTPVTGDHQATEHDPNAVKSTERFGGAVSADGKLVFTTSEDRAADRPARITFHLVAEGNRMVVLYERREGKQFARLAEVGYTRKGSAFAVKGVDPHECIVTGGHGTIAVDYKGNTYYFCCTGCKELFQQDPERVLAEYRERKAKEQTGGGNR